MKRGIFLLGILLILGITGFAYATSAYNDLHLNIQITYNNGSVETGTFDFVFNISNTSDCSSVVYSNSTTLTTDSNGIISYYLQNVNLTDYSQQYWLCYYRGGVLVDTSMLAKVPYSFYSNYVPSSGIISNGNINISGYNLTANYLFGNGQYLTGITLAPSNGIVVSGNNSNGSYIEFSDGTMIQWGETSVYANSITGTTFTFPVSWASPPNMNAIGTGQYRSGTAEANNVFPNITTSNFTLAHGYGITQALMWQAIGRWTNATNIQTNISALFGTNAANNIIEINTNQFVGIGTTSPNSLLDIKGNLSVDNGAAPGAVGNVQIIQGGVSPIANRLVFGTDNSGWKFAISKNVAGVISDLMTIQDNGNVGINTTTPQNTLNVVGDLNVTGNIYGNIPSSNGIWNQSGGNVYPTNLSWNVGIGTTTPTQALSVNGSENITGTLYGLYKQVSCTPSTSTYDCACPSGYYAIGGGATANNGGVNAGTGIKESRPMTNATGSYWEVTCLASTGTYGNTWADNTCAAAYAQCLKVG